MRSLLILAWFTASLGFSSVTSSQFSQKSSSVSLTSFLSPLHPDGARPVSKLTSSISDTGNIVDKTAGDRAGTNCVLGRVIQTRGGGGGTATVRTEVFNLVKNIVGAGT